MYTYVRIHLSCSAAGHAMAWYVHDWDALPLQLDPLSDCIAVEASLRYMLSMGLSIRTWKSVLMVCWKQKERF